MPTELTTTGFTTTGATSRPAGGDAIHTPLCASNMVEPGLSSAATETAASEPSTSLDAEPNADSWRVEVAARLERYRTRRKPRTPRYPSLLLPFDALENWSRSAPPGGSAAVATAPAQAEPDFTFPSFQTNDDPPAVGASVVAQPRQASQPSLGQDQYRDPGPSAKVIEFPRSAAIPVIGPNELADAIFDRPRIVEAPEMLPPPPALGGMLIEPARQEPVNRREGADCPLPSAAASIARRSLAALVDGVVLTTGLASFAAIFLRLNPGLNRVRLPLPMLAATLGVVAVLLWTAYEFLFVVYTGSTPGLRAARLRLAAFDGSPPTRRLRRWRVLASFLSAFSAGLGYLWCFLDQDGLCWHDRITRTHVQSAAPAE
jgi:uncharacterized RDD family membrane protein YckC